MPAAKNNSNNLIFNKRQEKTKNILPKTIVKKINININSVKPIHNKD